MQKTRNLKTQTKLRKHFRNNLPKAEQILWNHLKGKYFMAYKFRRQYGIDKYIIDFYCSELKLAIEVDGDSHYNKKAAIKDHIRTKQIENHGIRIIRFTNTDVYKNLPGVLESLKQFIERLRITTP